MYVRNLRQSIYLLIAIAVLSAPLLACAVPGFAMSEEEKECCQHMAEQCGSSQMEQSHTCCTQTSNVTASALQAPVKYSLVLPDCVNQSASDLVSTFEPCTAKSTASSLEHTESPP